MFSLIYAWINDWVNNREAGDLRRQRGHYDVIVMWWIFQELWEILADELKMRHSYPFYWVYLILEITSCIFFNKTTRVSYI